MTLKNGFGSCSLFVLSATGGKDQNMDSGRFSSKQNPNMEKALFDWLIMCCRMTSKRSID